MSPKEEQFRRLTEQALRLAWTIAENNTSACCPDSPPPSELARKEVIVAFHSIARALNELFKVKPNSFRPGLDFSEER